MGVPYFKVKDIIKTNNVAVFSGNHELYRDISKRVFKAMKEVLDDIEQYSVDEAFFVIESDAPEKVAESVKDKVEQLVGIPVSIGVAKSKTLAKLANDEAKRTTGIKVFTEADFARAKDVTNLYQIWGVGNGMSKRYRDYGIDTISDLVSIEDRQLKQVFGVVGLRLKNELLGNVVIGKNGPEVAQKSLMSSKSLPDATFDISLLQSALAHHVNSAAEALRKKNLKAGYLKVYIAPSRHGDFAFYNASAEYVFDKPSNITSVILKEATALLQKIYKNDVPYKKVGILMADLVNAEIEQIDLFAPEKNVDIELLQSSIDKINAKAGKGKILIGRTESDSKWKPKSELRSPSYTTRWKDLVTVKA